MAISKNIDINDVFKLMREFPCDFINANGELIIDHKTNTYCGFHNCESMEDVKAKLLLVMCRPIGKGLDRKDAVRLLKRFNDYFKSNLTREDMREIYGVLCYSEMLEQNKRFIMAGFPMDQLREFAKGEYGRGT